MGAVFCLEASRLARNGRDWHHLLELCALVDARVVDSDGMYDPKMPNDRLLLGLKGTMSEFELTGAASSAARGGASEGSSRRAADAGAGRLRVAARHRPDRRS